MNHRWGKILNDCSWVEVIDYDYDRDTEIVAQYNIGKDIPIFIFLDQEGNEFARLQGEIDRRELVKFLEDVEKGELVSV